jgi:ABC-2 type transport system permease protein
VVGAALATSLGVLKVSASAAAGTVASLVAWYLLGFFMYAFVFAAAGALVSRQEDAAQVVTPVLIPVIGGYVLGISVLPSDPGNSLCAVLSLIPVFSPTLMPMRLAMGGIPIWQAILSVVLVAAMIPVLIWLAGKVYRNAVVRTGARVKLAHALRPS